MSWPIRSLGALLAVVTVVGTLVSVMTGVVWLDGVRLERHLGRAVAVGPAPAVTVRAGGADVVVVAGPAGTVSVRQDLAARGLTRGIAEWAVHALTADVSVGNAGNAVIVSADRSACCLTSALVAEATDDLVVRLPAGATLRLAAASGDVEVGALSGPIDIATGSGRVALTDVSASRALRVRTGSGDIAFSGILDGGSIDLQADSGSISVRLPPDTGARLDARTVRGSLIVDPIWPVAHDRQLASGILGQRPDGSIRVATTSGDIAIGTR